MRARKRTDENQKDIVNSLREFGCSVKVVSDTRGFVDIVAGYRGINFLFEIKNPNMPLSKQALTPDEQRFHDSWLGSVYIITSSDEAIDIMKSFFS